MIFLQSDDLKVMWLLLSDPDSRADWNRLQMKKITMIYNTPCVYECVTFCVEAVQSAKKESVCVEPISGIGPKGFCTCWCQPFIFLGHTLCYPNPHTRMQITSTSTVSFISWEV